ICGEVSSCTLAPSGLDDGLSANDILIESPLTCAPFEDLVCGSREVAFNFSQKAVGFGIHSNFSVPWSQLTELLFCWYPLVRGGVFGPRLPGRATNSFPAFLFAWQSGARRQGREPAGNRRGIRSFQIERSDHRPHRVGSVSDHDRSYTYCNE